PLSGLRVVDFSWGLAGALATLVLADYGAEVIAVEPPGGSPLRGEAGFVVWGRGKKSVVVDLREAGGRATARRLIEQADVAVTSFRPGAGERLGLIYEDFAERHPSLVWASITGFGTRGPYAHLKGYEGVVMAKVGGMGHVDGMA